MSFSFSFSFTPLWRAPIASLVLLATSGCAFIQPVQPWEKGTLARPEMTIQGDPLETKFSEHIYSSREAASGGSSVGGGGCGCN
jgi:hypothetical protein